MFFFGGNYSIIKLNGLWKNLMENPVLLEEKNKDKRKIADGIYDFIAEKSDSNFFEIDELLDFLQKRASICGEDEDEINLIRILLDQMIYDGFLVRSDNDPDFFNIII